MSVQFPINWQTVEDAIQAWLAGSTGLNAIWRDQSAPQPVYPYASMLIISGPTKVGGQDEIRDSTDSSVSDIKVTPTAQNATIYTVTINGSPFAYLSDASATVAEIVAGLKAAIDAGSEPVATIDNGTDLGIVHNALGLFALELSSLLSYANNDLGHEAEELVCGLREMTVSCQVYSDDPINPAAHSRQYLSAAQSSLGLPAELVALRVAGISVIDEGSVGNIDAIEGEAYRSRSNMDVRFGLASNVAERTGYIDKIAVSSNLGVPASIDLDDEIIGD